MVSLLDVNLLIALAWPSHVHHTAARRWFRRARRAGWATCSFTEVAFVRISSNPRIFPDAPGPAQAAMTLRAIRRVPGHRFFEDPLSLADNPFLEMILGPQQVTDAHLLALAAYHGARLATFDRNIVRLLPDDSGRDTLLCILTPED